MDTQDIHAKFFKRGPRLTEALLCGGLAKSVDHDEVPDERVFAKGMSSLLRLDIRLPVEDRLSDIEGKFGNT